MYWCNEVLWPCSTSHQHHTVWQAPPHPEAHSVQLVRRTALQLTPRACQLQSAADRAPHSPATRCLPHRSLPSSRLRRAASGRRSALSLPAWAGQRSRLSRMRMRRSCSRASTACRWVRYCPRQRCMLMAVALVLVMLCVSAACGWMAVVPSTAVLVSTACRGGLSLFGCSFYYERDDDGRGESCVLYMSRRLGTMCQWHMK